MRLIPRDEQFYDLFQQLAGRLSLAATLLNQLFREPQRRAEHVQAIKAAEHEADGITHEIIDRLDRTFITPFDREDIHTLVGELDDIIDAIDALAKRVPLFHVKQMEAGFVQQADLLVEATRVVADAVHRLRKDRRLSELSKQLIEIHHKESIGDDNHHAAMSRLFAGGIEPLEVMKWKDLFDYIEEALDGCEDVGNTLERIVLKNG